MSHILFLNNNKIPSLLLNFFLLLPCLSLLPIPFVIKLIKTMKYYSTQALFYITFITLWFLVSLTVVSFHFHSTLLSSLELLLT